MEKEKLKLEDLEIHCESLIEFSSLTKVLLELIKRQKKTENKLQEHDYIINLLKNDKNIDTDFFMNNKENDISLNIESDLENINEFNQNSKESSKIYQEKTISNFQLKEETSGVKINKKTKDVSASQNQSEKNELNESIKEEKEDNKEKNTEENLEKNKKVEENKNIEGNKNIEENKYIDNNKNIEKEIKIKENITTDLKTSKNNINIPHKKLEETPDSKIKEENNQNVKSPKINSSKKNNSEIIPKILKKIKDIEKRLNDISGKINDYTQNQSNTKKINSLSKNLEEINQKFVHFNNDFDKIKEKVEDFDIYEVFKGNDDGSGANVDVCKALIKVLEAKVFKKFEFIQAKIKLNIDDIETNKNHINNNIMPNIDNLKKSNKEYGDKLSALEKLLENYKNENSDNLQIMIKKIDLNSKNIKSNEENIKLLEKTLTDKMKELEIKLKKEIENSITNKEIDNCKKSNNLSSEDLNFIKSLNKRIGELEKEFKAEITKIDIDEINKKIISLKKEMKEKAEKLEINDLKEKISLLENILKDHSFKIETLQQLQEKNKSENSQITKKIENLVGEFSMIKYNIDNHKEEKPIDLSKYIDNHQLNEVKKDTNIKFDKIKINLEDFGRNLEEILNRLSHTPTDVDFNTYQNLIKNMINEIKINCNKKYCDKYDTMKTLKFLETRIQNVQDSFNQKMDGSDNWLLAKKPINNFLCASCESVIKGELDKKSEYIPWNKYPMREEKYSRMGHGFSHILQMMNDEIKHSIEKENKNKESKKRSNSDENKNKNNEINDSNIENENSKKLNNNININTSAKLPNLKHKHHKKNSTDDGTLGERVDTSPYDDVFIDKLQAIRNNKPQIMRIIKRNKNINMTNVLSSPKQFHNLKESFLYNTSNNSKIQDSEKSRNIIPRGTQTINTQKIHKKSLDIINDEV